LEKSSRKMSLGNKGNTRKKCSRKNSKFAGIG
jgi:hypothetical protein